MTISVPVRGVGRAYAHNFEPVSVRTVANFGNGAVRNPRLLIPKGTRSMSTETRMAYARILASLLEREAKGESVDHTRIARLTNVLTEGVK